MLTTTAVSNTPEPRRRSKPLPDAEILSVSAAAARFSIGRSTLYREMKEGRLPRLKIGNKTLIPVAALRALVGATREAAA